MDVQLTRSLRDIQAVLEKFIDGLQRFFVEIVGVLALKDLPDEHPAERDRQLVDQAADSQTVVGDHILSAVEDFSHIQSHLGFFVGAGDFLDLVYDGSVGDADVCHVRAAEARKDLIRDLVQVFIALVFQKFLDEDDVPAVHCGDEITDSAVEDSADRLQDIDIPVIFCLNDIDHAAHVRIDVQLLRAVVDIHQQQVVQQEILDEIIPVEPLLVGGKQILHLERRKLSDHIDIVTGAFRKKHIFQLGFIEHLKELASVHQLRFRRRFREGKRSALKGLCPGKSACEDLAVHVRDTQVDPGDCFQALEGRLQNLIRNHNLLLSRSNASAQHTYFT